MCNVAVQLAVGLGPALYLWDGQTGNASMFQEFDLVDITAVKWDPTGTHIAIGMSDSTVLMFNVEQNKQVRILRGHSGRVTSLSWNGSTLTSGGAGDGIMNSDVRVKQHCKEMLRLHDKEVCGLAWSNEGDQLASGANDNLLAIWDNRYASPSIH
jgi:WD40 repeat protein